MRRESTKTAASIGSVTGRAISTLKIIARAALLLGTTRTGRNSTVLGMANTTVAVGLAPGRICATKEKQLMKPVASVVEGRSHVFRANRVQSANSLVGCPAMAQHRMTTALARRARPAAPTARIWILQRGAMVRAFTTDSAEIEPEPALMTKS